MTTPNNKQAQHTPGPWKMNPTGDVGPWMIGTADIPIATIETELPDRIWKANARLIAAAPELLEALSDLVQQIRNDGGINIVKARAAIAKAEGRQMQPDPLFRKDARQSASEVLYQARETKAEGRAS